MAAGRVGRHTFPVGVSSLTTAGPKLARVCGLCRYDGNVGDVAAGGTPRWHVVPTGKTKTSRNLPKSDSLCKVEGLAATPRLVASVLLAATAHNTGSSKHLKPAETHTAMLCATLWDDAMSCYDDDALSRKYGRFAQIADKMECAELHLHKTCRTLITRCATAAAELSGSSTSNAFAAAEGSLMRHEAALQVSI